MSRKGLYKQSMRFHGEKVKEKEKKCWECGSMPWRVDGIVCKECGLRFGEEEIEREKVSLKSSQGTIEDKF